MNAQLKFTCEGVAVFPHKSGMLQVLVISIPDIVHIVESDTSTVPTPEHVSVGFLGSTWLFMYPPMDIRFATVGW